MSSWPFPAYPQIHRYSCSRYLLLPKPVWHCNYYPATERCVASDFLLPNEIIADYLRGFSVFAEVCKPGKRIFIIRNDPHDNKFIEAAIGGKADFIVSGDHHLLDLKEYQGIKILTVKDFLEELKKEQKKKEPGAIR